MTYMLARRDVGLRTKLCCEGITGPFAYRSSANPLKRGSSTDISRTSGHLQTGRLADTTPYRHCGAHAWLFVGKWARYGPLTIARTPPHVWLVGFAAILHVHSARPWTSNWYAMFRRRGCALLMRLFRSIDHIRHRGLPWAMALLIPAAWSWLATPHDRHRTLEGAMTRI